MNRRVLVAVALLALAASRSAAARSLAPAPGARTLPSFPLAAEQRVGSVDVQVDAGAWRWGAVEGALRPVHVTLVNHGRRPLLVRYGHFALRGAFGEQRAPLPPYALAGEPPIAAAPPRPHDGFVPAPWSPRAYGEPAGLSPPDNPIYEEERQVDAPGYPPNEDVVRRALPEGILQPGGTVGGYLYFPDAPRGTRLTFVADLVDPESAQVEGTLAIPFVVR